MSGGVSTQQGLKPQVRRSILVWLVRSALGIMVYALIIFLSAGRLDWVWGWALLGVLTAVMLAHPLILVPINPDLLAERERGYWESGAKSWDKWITTAAGGLMPVPWVLAGLDLRFGWTGQTPLPYHLAGLFATILGYALFMWAMGSNAFFTNTARLQEERGHVVTTGGPYRFVRHPGYAGTIAVQLATPFLLGSPWALIPGAISAVLFVARAFLEDRMLQAELSGYREYAQHTRFRLVPGVW